MKKLRWLLVIVVLFSGLALAAEENYTLEYREQQEPIRYRTEMKFHFVFHWPKEFNMRPMEMGMAFRYDSTERWTMDGESAIRCSSIIDMVEVETEFLNQKISKKEDNLSSDSAIEVVMTPWGEVMDVVLPAFSTKDDEAEETEVVLPSFVSPEQILAINKTFYELIYHYLPDHSVKKGERWEITYVFPKLSESGESKFLPVTYELSKVQKSRGKRYATLLSSGQTVFDTIIDISAFAKKHTSDLNGEDLKEELEEELEAAGEDEKEAKELSALNKIVMTFPMQWKGKIVFGIDDGLLKERELILKGDGRIEAMSYLEKIPMRVTFETQLKIKRL
ncbi:MAG TPA: hypothetical protein PL004_06235 [Bacillota bacterium]|nr:hypothetical protein [Bacillota bacterium]